MAALLSTGSFRVRIGLHRVDEEGHDETNRKTQEARHKEHNHAGLIQAQEDSLP